MPPHLAATSARGAVDRGDAATSAVNALAIAGGIFAGAGIVMLVVDATQSHAKRVAFGVSPFGANLLVRFE